MAFWGVELKSKKPYIHRPDDDRGRLHVSQATLGAGSPTEKSIVQCKVGNKKPVYLCSLLPEKLETCALNLEFEEEDEVTFTVLGPRSVHLSGFFYGDDEDQDYQGDDYGSDACEEDIMVSDSDGDDDSLEFGSEDEDEYDEFSDDIGMFHPAPNSGVTIEEIVDDEKPSDDGMPKNSNKRSDKLTATGDDNRKQIVLRNGTPVALSESEDKDGFPLSSIETKSTSKPDLKLATSNDKAVCEKLEDKKDAVTVEASLKRKNNAAQDRKRVRESSTCEPSADSEKVKKKKNKKKGLTEKEEAPEDERPDSCRTEVSPVVATESDPKKSLEKKKNKKKKNKNDQQEASMTPKSDKMLTDGPGSSMEKRDPREAEPFQQRSFPNGLVVEEVKMGKPDGKRASPGKKVSVHYIGKLKKTGKIFDSNIGKAPFKFRLGIGQVIKGWDVGVNGMRVGDKRRLTIPPAMGYGAKGCGPAIPPNSWLVFDVELVDVN